jgi:hypothetical protein
MLVKGGTGSFSMVGGLVMSSPQRQYPRSAQSFSLRQFILKLIRRIH